jgi:putative ABC transport system permease protein
MLGAGHGLERGMMKNLDGLATNSCFFIPMETALPYKGFQKGRKWNLHNRDLDILRESIPEIANLSPILFAGNLSNNVVFNDNSGTYSVRGLHANYVEIERQQIEQGRFINEIDVLQTRKVCVIGMKVYEELFPTKGNPIGCYIRVNEIYYQVVGVVSGVSSSSLFGRMEESVVIPFTTMQKITNAGDIIHMLAATPISGYSATEMETKMKEIIRANNKISPDDMQAIANFNLEQIFNIFKYLFLGIAILIWIVGSGMLFSGIVGVSNIMMITVKERTKEIGIRRALGAKPRTILGQIIMETLVLTLIAGLLGLSFGVQCLYWADVYWLQKAENVFLSDPII